MPNQIRLSRPLLFYNSIALNSNFKIEVRIAYLLVAMTQLRITVVKTFSPEDVFGHEFRLGSGQIVLKCHLEEGQSWVTDGWSIPEGFCSWAWEDLRKDRYMLYFGGNIPDTEEGTVFVSCSDGKRPVVFKLERL